jgi:O-antigen/teichoic acid export membrane protein
MLIKYRKLLGEGGWILTSQLASVLGALVLVKVLTESLEPHEYGQLALALTVASFINQIVMVGLNAGIGRFYSIAAEEGDLPGYLRASFQLLAKASIVLIFISLVFIACLFWLGYIQWVGLAVAALAFSVFSGYSACLNSIQNSARHRATVAALNGMDALLKIILVVCVVRIFGNSSIAVIAAYTSSAIIVTGIQLFLLRRFRSVDGKKWHADEHWKVRIWKFAQPFTYWGIFTWAQQVSDRWALQNFSNTDEVGLYAVIFQLGYVPLGVITSFATSFAGPILYQRSGHAQDDTRNRSVHLIAWRITFGSLAVTALVFSFAFMTHEWIFSILVGPSYQSVSYLLPWMVLAGGSIAAGQALALKLMSEMKSSEMAYAKILTAIFCVVMNVLGALWYGMQGVVGALVIFSICYLVWMALLARRTPNIS